MIFGQNIQTLVKEFLKTQRANMPQVPDVDEFETDLDRCTPPDRR